MIQQPIKVEDPANEHVFIHVQCPEDVADISIDITNTHGRRTLSVRVDGMGIGGLLIDRDIVPGKEEMKRFCPYCGERLNLFSSRTHDCT